MVKKDGRRARMALVGAVAGASLIFFTPAPAQAQDDPNTGALAFTGAFDVLPGVPYIFRGIIQESDPKITMWPYADLGISFFSGDGGLKSAGINFGVWNSLHTGSSGTGDGCSLCLGAHYEEDFYATLALGFGGGVTLGTTFTAYSSPNSLFTTVEEFSFKVSKTHMLAPYGVLAFEMGESGQADAGENNGTYLELGVGPSWPLLGGAATVAVPVKFGFSLGDYYEGPEGDQGFGFFDIGGLVTIPLSGAPGRFGSWNVHAGMDILYFPGESSLLRLLNDGDSSKVVGLFGIGVSY
jgi:hypothetical protein